jgi:hypothetical protein
MQMRKRVQVFNFSDNIRSRIFFIHHFVWKGAVMRKSLMIIFSLLVVLPYGSFAADTANYEVTINGEIYDVSLGQEYQAQLASGQVVTFKIGKKAIMTYRDDFISFKHKSELSISTTDLGSGIRQTMTNTAVGTLILFQEYTSMNPTSLVNLMLQELTKEQTNYGYKMNKQSTSKTLKDGSTLKGKIAILTYGEEEEHWSVLAYGKRDKGVLVITKINKEYMDREKDILDLMWASLDIKM